MEQPIRIHNSLTREKEEFKPLNPPKVNMYTCGVTVYDESHIGHARSLYIFDLIRRYLKYRGYEVKFVRNITDIDDKIINRANELKMDWKELVKKYIDSYYTDLQLLGIEKGDFEPRATENIPAMIEYIEALIAKGYAYPTESGVYFNVRKFSKYGQLSGQSIESMLSGVRKEVDEAKNDPLDFVLWKKSKEGEPSWDSPWGFGRPGWHIECSVMSQKFLKTDTLDIHAGGRDLIFPHHENETAQAEALTGKPFAKYWLHHGLLTINGQKMSKSLGNFMTIKDVLSKYPADVLKIFYLQAHYSNPIDFTWERLEEAKAAKGGFDIFFDKVERIKSRNTNIPPPGSQPVFIQTIDKLKIGFNEAMNDNFNTPQALSCLFEMLHKTNEDSHREVQDTVYAEQVIKDLGKVLGLFMENKTEIAAEKKTYIEAKIKERNEAKRLKDFKKADAIRSELLDKDIILEDTPDGTTWRRKI